MKKWIAGTMAAVMALSGAAVAATAAPAADAPTVDGKTLVTFGDSLTALSTWPNQAADNLNMRLVNSGIGGHTSADGLARFDRDVAAKNPDFVTIAFATNDFVRPTPGQAVSQVSLADFRTNMETIVDKVAALDAVPILFTAPFVREDAYGLQGNYEAEGGLTALLDKYNAVIREIAQEKNVGLVDMREVSKGYTIAEFLVADGVHLSATGQKAYADALTAYMEEHYNRDPSVPPIEKPQRPGVEPGTWTKSLISTDLNDWLEPKPGTIQASVTDGVLSVANTTGLWPEYHYSPTIDKGINVPVAGSTLNFDFTTDGAGTNIILFFNGSTPTLAYDQNYVYLPRVIKKFYPSVKLSGDDIVAGQTVKGSIPLSKLGIPESAIDEDGNVLFSGVKLYAVGTKGKPVVIRELSVTKGDGEEPEEPTYEKITSLLPVSGDNVSADVGTADVTYNADGSLTLTRAAASSVSWPSIAVALDQTVDLDAQPYLHLKMTPGAGTANGYLFYQDAEGEQKSMQLSQMVYGSEQDIEGSLDEYIDLAAKLGETGSITLTKLTLSVYGNAGDALTWNDISLMKQVEGTKPTGTTGTTTTDTTGTSDTTGTTGSATTADTSATTAETSVATNTTGAASTATTAVKGENPQTGDSVAMLLFGGLALIGSAGALVYTGKARRR